MREKLEWNGKETRIICIRKSGSILDRCTDYPEVFHYVSQFPGECWDIRLPWNRSQLYTYKSSVVNIHNHSLIPLDIVLV